ncbi:hypothetical protein CIP107507_00966 [Corynebacterium diphtheriae]|nr:hypothetical protein CIP107507_00966 [Corynebacterium diphtheriae]CAB0645401.1 hypothetical protein CIP107573_01051 [Corynebacterium diphtheriae]
MNSLKRAIDVVDDSGVELLIDIWRAKDGYDPSKGGRPAMIQPRTVLTLMALLTIEAKPLHIQQAVNIITDRATNQVLRALGLPQRYETDYTTYKGRQAWYKKVYRAGNKVKDVIDPNPTLTYRKRLTADKFDYPMSKPEKLQIPLRKAGYKVMVDLVKGQMGLQATYHGAQLIDDSWYFPGMPARWRDASAIFAAGEMNRDELYDIIDRRQAFALQVRKTHEDGSIDFYSPARGKRAKLKVDGIGVDKSLEGATLRKAFARDLTKEDRNSAVFKQTQIRIPVDAAAKHVQTGRPSWGMQEWLTLIGVGVTRLRAVTPFSRTGVWDWGTRLGVSFVGSLTRPS